MTIVYEKERCPKCGAVLECSSESADDGGRLIKCSCPKCQYKGESIVPKEQIDRIKRSME